MILLYVEINNRIRLHFRDNGATIDVNRTNDNQSRCVIMHLGQVFKSITQNYLNLL